jgi:hypothetical protein
MNRLHKSWLAAALLAAVAVSAAVQRIHGQATETGSLPLPLKMTAWAVNMSNTATGANGIVEIRITQWSTAAERQALIGTFLDKGQDKLLDALQDVKAHGRIRLPGAMGPGRASAQGSLGNDLRYAWHTKLPDGGDRIVIGTDRYISFQEQANQPRTIDYPFTFIQIQLPKGGGEGEGKLAYATKLSFDKKKNAVEMENYGTEPVRLNQIKIVKD